MKKMKRDGNTTTILYGYQIEKETFSIKEDEAKVITFIFDSYLQGLGYKRIIKMLKDNQIPSPKGNEVRCQSTIETILTNEKYTEDNLLQRHFMESRLRMLIMH